MLCHLFCHAVSCAHTPEQFWFRVSAILLVAFADDINILLWQAGSHMAFLGICWCPLCCEVTIVLPQYLVPLAISIEAALAKSGTISWMFFPRLSTTFISVQKPCYLALGRNQVATEARRTQNNYLPFQWPHAAYPACGFCGFSSDAFSISFIAPIIFLLWDGCLMKQVFPWLGCSSFQVLHAWETSTTPETFW